jgi:hypothetical protein
MPIHRLSSQVCLSVQGCQLGLRDFQETMQSDRRAKDRVLEHVCILAFCRPIIRALPYPFRDHRAWIHNLRLKIKIGWPGENKGHLNGAAWRPRGA